MFVQVNGARLFFDVEGAGLVRQSCVIASRCLTRSPLGEGEQRGRYRESERLRGSEVERQFEFCCLIKWDLSGFSTLQYLIYLTRGVYMQALPFD